MYSEYPLSFGIHSLSSTTSFLISSVSASPSNCWDVSCVHRRPFDETNRESYPSRTLLISFRPLVSRVDLTLFIRAIFLSGRKSRTVPSSWRYAFIPSNKVNA